MRRSSSASFLGGVTLATAVCACQRPVAAAVAEPRAQSVASAVATAALPRQTGVSGLISFALPEGASAHEIFAAQGGQYLKTDAYVSGPCPGNDAWSRSACVSVAFERRDGPGWKTLAEATGFWDGGGGDERRKLGEGVTDAGVLYAVRSFSVRVGFSSDGDSIHRDIRVSRVHAGLSVGDGGHVTCTGYLERDVKTLEDPQIQTLLAICTSMRRAR